MLLPGWDSAKRVDSIHSGLEIIGLLSFAVAIVLEAFDIRLGSIIGFSVLVLAETFRYAYGRREKRLSEEAIEHERELSRDNERRIEELRLLAEQERTARVKLEKRYGPRRISRATYERMSDVLRPHVGKVDIFVFDIHVTDVQRLAADINAAFVNSGWDARPWWVSSGEKMGDTGLTFGIAKEAWTADTELARVAKGLVEALRQDEIRASIAFAGFSALYEKVLLMNGKGKWDPRNVAPLRVEVAQISVVSSADWNPQRDDNPQ